MVNSSIKTLLFLGLFASVSSLAETGWYGKAGVSYAFEKSVAVESRDYTYSGGPGLQVGLGYDFEMFSIEGEYTYTWLSNDRVQDLSIGEDSATNGHQALNTVMVNAIYHPVEDFDFVPYVGLGVGYGMVSWDSSQTDNGISGDDTTYVYQVLLGTYYELTNDLSLNIEYRFRGLGAYTLEDGGEISSDKTNELSLGLLYHF